LSGRRPLFDLKLATSVKIGDLFVTANSIAPALSNYTQPALFYAHAQADHLGPYGLSIGGTAFKIRYRNRYFCLVSAHQLKSPNALYEHEELCIHSGANNRLLTSHKAIFAADDDELSFDAILYEFTDVVIDERLPSSGWYPINEKEITAGNPKPIRAFAVGFPGIYNSIDYSAQSYSFTPYCVWGDETAPMVPERLAFSPNPQVDFDPSGMSGSPVFGLDIDDLIPRVFFAGLLTNASKQIFHFMPRKRLGALFRYALE
jgi:hypothetical protein